MPPARAAAFTAVVLLLPIIGPSSRAAEVVMKDGRVLHGRLAEVASLGDVLQMGDAGGPKQIIMVDDQLRRTFVPDSPRQVLNIRQAVAGEPTTEEFEIRQRIMHQGRTVQSVGPILRTTPFDEFGRRILSMNTRQGPVDVVQAITRLTPEWTQVEGITHVWDMRVATSSIPTAELNRMLARQSDPNNLEHYKKIARFYLQAERFRDARRVLQHAVDTLPDGDQVREQLAPSIRAIRQLGARRLLDELQRRREAGQHRLVYAGLQDFPSEGVAGEILQEVREMAQDYAQTRTRGHATLERIEELLKQTADPGTRDNLRPAIDEIRARLSINTLPRMATFRQHADDDQLKPEQRLALALSGWLVGSDRATSNLPVALSLFHVRTLVREYLNEPLRPKREVIFARMASEEGATPSMIAALLAHMRPPAPVPEPVAADKPGLYELKVDTLPGEAPVTYLVQTPPEYDPHRLYPAIVSLRGAGTTAEHQIDWWAGGWRPVGGSPSADAAAPSEDADAAAEKTDAPADAHPPSRAGQATRHGYIVIAPKWTVEHQKHYAYSAREHAAVLGCLRDACRRFAIDTDRVYLSGHSIGGDAAWDLGLAHPDLWAGVIPIVPSADRYCSFYSDNGEWVPWYFVFGERDAAAALAENAGVLDRYFRRAYDVTVVEFRGRGHEDFYDEVLRIFDWMERQKRNFFPREFECVTMRQFDNFFWWVELSGLPEATVVDPRDWPPSRGTRPLQLKAQITATGNLRVQTGSSTTTVWISPEMIDMEQRSLVMINGRRINGRDPFIQPDLRTLLEDARTRADRQHPFWAKVEAKTGR